MPASKLDIFNMALGHLGVGIRITNVDANTAAAQACRLFYDQVVEEVLGDAPWPFATAYPELVEVPDGENPNDEFDYAYDYPADTVRVRRLLNGASRLETPTSKIRYRIAESFDGTSQVILTDHFLETGVFAEVTALVTDPTLFPRDFVMAVSLLLAAYIAPTVANEKPRLRTTAYELFRRQIGKAKANAFNEEAPDEYPDSEFERART